MWGTGTNEGPLGKARESLFVREFVVSPGGLEPPAGPGTRQRDPFAIPRFDAWLIRLTVHASYREARRRRGRAVEMVVAPTQRARTNARLVRLILWITILVHPGS